MSIRVSVSAVIVRDGHLLLCEFEDNGLHYNLPGGGVESGESLHEAVIREVMEETRAQVTVGRMLYTYEYVPRLADYRWGGQQTVRFIFECVLVPGSEPGMPIVPDDLQIGVRWIPLDELDAVLIIPLMTARWVRETLRKPLENAFVGLVT